MSETRVTIVLSSDERELVEALREIPESPLRRKLSVLLRELFSFSRQPRCAEAQADGVPCDNSSSQCDQCARVTRVLDALIQRVTEQERNG